MAERLLKRTMESNIVLSGRLLDSLVYVFTESQQWRQLIDLLAALNTKNCEPEVKTLNYLKKNLLYCFEPQTRSQLKEQIEHLEDNFFIGQSAATAGTGEDATKANRRGTGYRKQTGGPKVGDEVAEEDETESSDKRRPQQKRTGSRQGRRQQPAEVTVEV